MSHKQCRSCLETKPLEKFRKRGQFHDHTCNKCKRDAREEQLADIQAAARRQRARTPDCHKLEVMRLTAKRRKFLAQFCQQGKTL